VTTVRPVLTTADIDTYLEVRNRVHPETPMPREWVIEQRTKPDNLDLIAEREGGVAVGVATVSRFRGAPDGDLAYTTLRVPREERRQGIGTALFRRTSQHARDLGKTGTLVVVRHDDVDSLAFYASRGFEERGRMQDVRLELATADVTAAPPEGIEIVPLSEELARGAYAVALEADADIPAAEPLVTGTFEQWRERQLGELTLRHLSFVAVEDGRVVGYAILGRDGADTANHWMTGVARAARGRGVAVALKRAQIAGAKADGWAFLRTQNDLANAAMRAVNEKLGYERRFEWVHLAGPLAPA
jgi:GNAT superfamily N-acetyltransferase